MAVDPVSLTGQSTLSLTGNDDNSGGSTLIDEGVTKKIDPNSENEVLEAAVENFLPGMISNQLFLNNTLFNFAKEAIDEADQ